MTKSHSMNHCTCQFEIGVPSVSPHVEQMTHFVAEARQNQVTHRCSWIFCFSLGAKTVTSNLPLPSWCWWIAFPAWLGVLHRDKQGCSGTHVSVCVCASLDWWAHTDVTIRHDQEHALGDLTRLVRERRGHSTYLERAPVASQQSVGAIERAASLETVSRGATPASQIIPASVACKALWVVCHALFRQAIRTNSIQDTQEQEILGRNCVGWSEKIWLRKSEISDKHLCSDGRTKHSTVQRQPPARWA